MTFNYNDGGREFYGFAESGHDCVIRAIAITAGLSYAIVHTELAAIAPNMAKEGINVQAIPFYAYMHKLGFTLVDGVTTMQDIPEGRVIACTSGHYTAIVNGTIQDTHSEAHKTVTHYWVFGELFDVYKGPMKLNSNPLNRVQARTMRRLYTINYKSTAFIHLKAV